MSCKVTKLSLYEYVFDCLSGTSAADDICTINQGDKNIKHFVIVSPSRKKFNKIRVTGRINADVQNANAKFDGSSVRSNVEWQEVKDISTAVVTFSSASIRHVRPGSDNIQTLVEEISWKGAFKRVDHNDLTFTIRLS